MMHSRKPTPQLVLSRLYLITKGSGFHGGLAQSEYQLWSANLHSLAKSAKSHKDCGRRTKTPDNSRPNSPKRNPGLFFVVGLLWLGYALPRQGAPGQRDIGPGVVVRGGNYLMQDIAGNSPFAVAQAYQLMDKSLQRIRARCDRMGKDLDNMFGSRLELHNIQVSSLEKVVIPYARELFQEVTLTMLQVLRILQPADFAGKNVNFYFWPGYHSHLIDRRVFYSDVLTAAPAQDMGVGICGDPGLANLETYNDCCQARWYRLGFPPSTTKFPQANPYHWFEQQRPAASADPHNLIASITFSSGASIPEDEAFPEHTRRSLTDQSGGSEAWGQEVADLLNGFEHVRHPGWKFPDYADLEVVGPAAAERELRLRKTRLMLRGLWLHSAFAFEEPKWWNALTAELEQQKLVKMLKQISDARNDSVASDWGDESFRRPPFTNWTTICLQPLAIPLPSPIIGPQDNADDPSIQDGHNICWATLLCSVPLGLPFISMTRAWLGNVYETFRNAEVSPVFKHREPLQRAAQMVRTLSHEMDKFMKEILDPILSKIGDPSPEVVAQRRFFLLVLRVLIRLTYGLSSAAPDKAKAIGFHAEFVTSLLLGPRHLKAVIHRVALDVQHHYSRPGKARVDVEELAQKDLKEPVESALTYASCLLLVGEIVRNYCEHAPAGNVAKLTVNSNRDSLVIVLEGPVKETPPGVTFGLLHTFMETLELGYARFKRDENNNCTWTVRVDLQ